jgi:hypothetical protein
MLGAWSHRQMAASPCRLTILPELPHKPGPKDGNARGDRAWLVGSLAFSAGDEFTDPDQWLAPVALQFASPARALDEVTVLSGLTARWLP